MLARIQTIVFANMFVNCCEAAFSNHLKVQIGIARGLVCDKMKMQKNADCKLQDLQTCRLADLQKADYNKIFLLAELVNFP